MQCPTSPDGLHLMARAPLPPRVEVLDEYAVRVEPAVLTCEYCGTVRREERHTRAPLPGAACDDLPVAA